MFNTLLLFAAAAPHGGALGHGLLLTCFLASLHLSLLCAHHVDLWWWSPHCHGCQSIHCPPSNSISQVQCNATQLSGFLLSLKAIPCLALSFFRVITHHNSFHELAQDLNNASKGGWLTFDLDEHLSTCVCPLWVSSPTSPVYFEYSACFISEGTSNPPCRRQVTLRLAHALICLHWSKNSEFLPVALLYLHVFFMTLPRGTLDYNVYGYRNN